MSPAALKQGNKAAHSERSLGGLGLPVAGAVAALLLVVVGAMLAAKHDEQLPTLYGKRRGAEAAKSVNGTAVLAEMFRASGHTVTTMSRFSPKLEKQDVIVWIPDDFEPPDTEHRTHLETWLKNSPGRTLIYVGRDYDAGVEYWRQMSSNPSADEASEILHRQAAARATWEAERSRMPHEEYARWFTVRRDVPPHRVQQLTGPWADGVDAAKANVYSEGRLDVPIAADVPKGVGSPELPEKIEPLLLGDGQPLVSQITDEDWDGGQLIVVNNGSFVLNFPLVNHEHRQLAAQLIAACGDDKKVVFIESEADGPPILTKEPKAGRPTALDLLKVWPLNSILLHVTVMGLVLCLSRSLIFGRPRELPADSPADFGKHVTALGKLLARTKDRNYAQARISQYRQIAERRSGRSHLKSK
jgi:hypothetical protein